MRNILIVLFACLILYLLLWFLPAQVQTYFGVSREVATWVFLGVLALPGLVAYLTRPRAD